MNAEQLNGILCTYLFFVGFNTGLDFLQGRLVGLEGLKIIFADHLKSLLEVESKKAYQYRFSLLLIV